MLLPRIMQSLLIFRLPRRRTSGDLMRFIPFVRLFRWPRWLVIAAYITAALLLSFWLALRFWLPEFARGRAEIALTESLQRPVSIGAIELRPFAMELTVRDFSIAGGLRTQGADGGVEEAPPLLAFDEFHVNVSAASLWHGAPVISALRLAGPRVHVVRDRDGRLLLPDFGGKAPPARGDEQPAGPLPDFSLANLEISGGRFVFEDRQKGSRQELAELALAIPFAGTIDHQEDSWVEPFFKARINGAALELKGKVKPFVDRREAALELRLNDFDLTRLDEYAPLPPGLRLLAAKLDVALDVVFVQAPGKPLSLQVKGHTALRDLQVENVGGAPYQARARRVALKIEDFDAALKLPIRAGLVIEDLSLREKGAASALVDLPRFEAGELALDLAARSANLGVLRLDGLRLALQREADGRLDLLRVLVPPAASGVQKKSPNATLPAAEKLPVAAAPVWQGKLKLVALNDARLHFADRTLAKAPPLNVEGLALRLDDVDLGGRQPARLKLAATVNQRGRLAVEGRAGWAPLNAELALDVHELDLVPLQGWAGDLLKVLISRGTVSVGGKLALTTPEGGTPVARFDGDARLAGFNVFDRANSSDILNFKAIEFSGLRFVSAPLAVELKRLTLDQLFARAILGADGQLNLTQLTRAQEAAGPLPPVAPPALETAPAGPAPAAKAALPFKVGEVLIRQTRVDFSDRFIKPPYHASLTGLDGRIAPLEAGQRGRIELTGAVDRAAPLSISGEVDPFASALYLNVAARIKGVDMPPLSTYAERHLGYQVAKGKLSLDLRYFVENRQLKAENQLFLDQLTFGEPVDSPDALSLPVTLAVALLKNSRGEIDLKLPIAGSLDDPEFKVTRIVFKVLGNLIVKAVSSPFSLLAAAFGDGEELSEIGFVAGRAAPEAEGEKRLRSLAAALLDRPGLTLEITGQADPDADRAALGRALLDRRLRARKLEETTGKGVEGGALRDVTLSAEERQRYLLALAREAAGAPVSAPAGSGTAAAKGNKAAVPTVAAEDVPRLEEVLLAGQTVGEDELRQLAERRGRSVRNWLVEEGKVPVERVFLLVPRLESADGKAASRAVFSLR